MCRIINPNHKYQAPLNHSPLYLLLLLCIYPAENIQTSSGDHPSNTGGCQTPHHRPAKTYFQLFLVTPTDGGLWNSSPARSSTVHRQLELLGTVENTVFAGWWCGVCPNLVNPAQPNQANHSSLISTAQANQTIRQGQGWGRC